MNARRYLFPNVIELNLQAGERLGVNVYLIEDAGEYVLIDVGYEDTVEAVLDVIRRMDFSLSACKLLVATHADVDHSQALARAKAALKCPVAAHEACVQALETGDRETTFARISAQGVDLPMPAVKVDRALREGDELHIGGLRLQVWSTPGHAPGQLAFKLRDLLFVGDNIYRDGSVGVIDAHHGSALPDFVRSLERIRADDSAWLLPSHGPVFRRDNAMIDATIARLKGYMKLADFGTCATDWPLLAEWDAEIAAGRSDAWEAGTAAPRQRLPGALS